MTVNRFYIETDDAVRSYFPGQVVSGKLIVKSAFEIKTEGIKIRFLGSASVLWTEIRVEFDSHREGYENVTYTHRKDKDYFNHTIYITTEGQQVSIPSGSYSYPFTFQLPVELPSSFKGPFGRVSYSVGATMKRSWHGMVWYGDTVASCVPFTVKTVVDLDTNHWGLLPIEVKKHSNICGLFCKSGPVGFIIKLPKSVYVPGEKIYITGEIFNRSRNKIKKTSLFLRQVITYRAGSSRKTTEEILCVAHGPCPRKGESEHWVGNILEIPEVPPTSLHRHIIDVQYYLNIKLDFPYLAKSLEKSFLVIIGSIPLRNTHERSTHVPQLNVCDPSIFSAPPESSFNEDFECTKL